MRFRLIALDLDGTLLDPFGKLSAAVVEAVASLRRAGPQVILCTGRRYRTALPMAQQLGLEGAMVTNNGVLVKDIATGRTLQDNGLQVVDEIMRSSTIMVANQDAIRDDAKREAIDELRMLIESVLDARSRVLLEMNVPKARLDAIIEMLPVDEAHLHNFQLSRFDAPLIATRRLMARRYAAGVTAQPAARPTAASRTCPSVIPARQIS